MRKRSIVDFARPSRLWKIGFLNHPASLAGRFGETRSSFSDPAPKVLSAENGSKEAKNIGPYFPLDSQAPSFRRGDVIVRVGAKELEDPLPICYCFGFTRQDIWDEIGRSISWHSKFLFGRRLRPRTTKLYVAALLRPSNTVVPLHMALFG
jgi:hypothetical protein